MIKVLRESKMTFEEQLKAALFIDNTVVDEEASSVIDSVRSEIKESASDINAELRKRRKKMHRQMGISSAMSEAGDMRRVDMAKLEELEVELRRSMKEDYSNSTSSKRSGSAEPSASTHSTPKGSPANSPKGKARNVKRKTGPKRPKGGKRRRPSSRPSSRKSKSRSNTPTE